MNIAEALETLAAAGGDRVVIAGVVISLRMAAIADGINAVRRSPASYGLAPVSDWEALVDYLAELYAAGVSDKEAGILVKVWERVGELR